VPLSFSRVVNIKLIFVCVSIIIELSILASGIITDSLILCLSLLFIAALLGCGLGYLLFRDRYLELLKKIKVKQFHSMGKDKHKDNAKNSNNKVNDSSTQDTVTSQIQKTTDSQTEDTSNEFLHADDIVSVSTIPPAVRIPNITQQIDDHGTSKKISIMSDIVCNIEYCIKQEGENEIYTKYTKPFEVNGNCKIIIIARSEKDESLKQQVEFEINGFKVPNPEIHFDEKSREIEMSAISGAEIRYTIDGSIPSEKSELYKNPIRVKKSCTLKCYAVRPYWLPSNMVEYKIKVIPTPEERVRTFTDCSKENVLGISYRGESHVKSDTVCQDFHSFTRISENWSLAIVSDGAGSAAHSDMGSQAVCLAFTDYISKLVARDPEFSGGRLPSEKAWDIEFRGLLNKFQKDIASIAQNNKIDLKSLAATIIILLFSKNGYLTAHVGDGRGAVKVNGEWLPLFTPHKGEEANMTIFSTTINFASNPSFKMSGNYVPETHVSDIPAEAFALMSDGCECGLWKMNERIDLPNGDFRIEERNEPFAKGLSDAIELCKTIDSDSKNRLISFVTGYNNPLRKEIDDKTLLIGII